MIADVTQNLIVRIVPVNRPSEINQYGEQQGYYHAFVTSGHDYKHAEHVFEIAQSEWMRGIVHSGVGYGANGTVMGAIGNAFRDYEDKFGPLCQVDINAVA